ncbi:unnamed protein product [Timema podura]|uniref:Uncharacterized protein n=1 Tax=Timema podura TaxID=61482 RepID=A0ABN7NZM1_TIMPD|nr:unnamed protein product [Timema podura]
MCDVCRYGKLLVGDQTFEDEPKNIDKRSVENRNMSDQVYDYNQFQDEYSHDVQEKVRQNLAFNYTDKGKPEETVEEAVDKIVDFETPVNCSVETARNFGYKSVRCLWWDLTETNKWSARKRLAKRVGRIVGIWMLIYTCIAVPFWCHKVHPARIQTPHLAIIGSLVYCKSDALNHAAPETDKFEVEANRIDPLPISSGAGKQNIMLQETKQRVVLMF